VQIAEWVNMMQRTQTGHLPDPYDPTPVQQGIGVYYTNLQWGGISFAILEDRKWKSPPKVVLPQAGIVNGWAQNSAYHAARDGDVPGAELLGPRQLAFLDQWAQDWRGKVWMKVALSQTLFANLATLPPPANTDAVVPKLPIPRAGEYIRGDIQASDHDSNGWPQSGRNAAVRALRRAAAVHLCGDQHLGSTLQYGIDEWGDGSFAMCSPALSNLFPRRWYPPEPGRNGRPHSPANTGEYLDGFGNKVTVHAVFNPEQAQEPNPLVDRSPGFGIAEFDRNTREITLTVYARRDGKPVKGWPVRIQLLDNGWSKTKFLLPSISADGLRDFCVQVRHQGEILYTVRIQGESFAPPVPKAGIYSVRVFEPDGKYDRTLADVEAKPRGQVG
jgi:alkaline phosphatase D